ncbi:zinc finger BED domain-containing protein 1-like [Gadus morhua]|uniref:Zinc finger BED domain-containing protein 1-like n=1 Tax=Gadus morhua TaxID=8049 RepID=A0A8C5FQD6_GADMO|nr:zinc finger BED domain-containing protein 1-like [Gadus morhua]
MHESHTGANVAEVLKTATEEWGISNKPIVLVTDNASNMVVAAQVGGYLHVKCFAHTLNLASQRALKLPAVARLLGRVRRITTFFHRSTIANSMLEQKQKLLDLPTHKLKTDVVTRWNSGYEMLQRFLEQQPAICAALLSSDVRRSGSDICTLNENDITDAEDIMQALRPMFVATKIVSEEKNPTLSIIAPVHAKLLNDTHQAMGDKPIVRDIKQAINQDLQKRYSTVEEKNTLHTASALDPRFKSLPFLTTDDISATYSKLVVEAASLQLTIRQEEQGTSSASGIEMDGQDLEVLEEPQPKRRSGLADLLGETFSTTAPLKSAFSKAEEEVNRYQEASPLPLEENPLNWWKAHEKMYPFLAKLAKRYLSIPGTSVSAERVFSTAGDIGTAQRSTLTSEHVDQLLFLSKNASIPK